MKKAIMSVLTVWILVSSMFIGLISFSDIENVQAPYIPHSPIRINSDAEFASMAGSEGWTGNGLPGSPYIIEGYDINGSGYGYCIYIGNTTVYFEVRDCYLHEANGVYNKPYFTDSGLTLYKAHNGTLANNTASSNSWYGIYLYYSSSYTIANNNVSNNTHGIRLYYSSNNTITNNNASSNIWNGINLWESSNNTVANNIAYTNNEGGIYLYSSNSNTITNNKASSNNLYGIELIFSSSNTIANNTPSNNSAGISFSSSNSNTIVNNTASNNNYGIHLMSSSNNTIANNNASNNNKGIYIWESSNIIITNNNATSNKYNGISLWESSNNTVANNNASWNNQCGIQLTFSSNNTIANNTVSSNIWDGIRLWLSSNNTIVNNRISSNSQYGIYLAQSISNTFVNNEMLANGILIWGDMLKHWNTHIIDTTNTVNGKPVHYWKNQTGGIIPLGAGQVILANSTDVVVENQNVSDCSVGIELGFSSNNTIANNIAYTNNEGGIYLYSSNSNTITNNKASSNNDYGIFLHISSNNTITNNNASNNSSGIYLSSSNNNTIINNTASNSDYGITITGSNNTITNNTVSSNNVYGIRITNLYNRIFHNNISGNAIQADDPTNNGNQWDNGYPSGGNYWSDYAGSDSFKGPNQDIPGSDGIGDTPYIIDANSQDNYPLMSPFTNRTFDNYLTLQEGWNLLSIPSIQESQNPKKVLEMIDGWYDAVQWYNNTNLNDPWKHYRPGKPFGNDLFHLNETMGFWIHITNPGDTIFLYNGTQPTSNQSISLHPGWNMVGYPSLTNRNRTAALNNLTFGSEVDAIWTFNAATQKWEEIGGGDYFEVGRGYWIHATQECVWEVGV